MNYLPGTASLIEEIDSRSTVIFSKFFVVMQWIESRVPSRSQRTMIKSGLADVRMM